MRDKDYYRQLILRVKPYLNFTKVCDEVGITRQAMYYFLKGVDSAISLEVLQEFVNFIDSL